MSFPEYDLIQELKKASGKKREEVLHKYMKEHRIETEMLLKAALNPFVTYGIKKIPEFDCVDSDVAPMNSSAWGSSIYDLAQKLADRSLTGRAAIEAIQEHLSFCSQEQAEVSVAIIKKDLPGISAKTVNKVAPNMIPYFDVMLSHKYEEKRIKEWPASVEIKLDGVRCLAMVQFTVSGATVKFLSRTGKPINDFPAIRTSLYKWCKKLKDRAAFFSTLASSGFVIDGEIISKDNQFNTIVGETHKKENSEIAAELHAFEMFTLDEFLNGSGYMKNLYPQRRHRLEMAFKFYDARVDTLGNIEEFKEVVKLSRRYIVNSHDEIEHYYQTFRNKGFEGAIVKPNNFPYEKKRSFGWLKIKDRNTVDVEITGLQEGTGKFEGQLGALVVNFEGVTVNVGSGLTDALRESIWLDKDSHIGRLVEVEYHEVTPDKSLRHPRFIRFRDDKPVEDGVGV